jgi:hypothetical protein
MRKPDIASRTVLLARSGLPSPPGELYNVEFATFEAIKDPIKAAAKK